MRPALRLLICWLALAQPAMAGDIAAIDGAPEGFEQLDQPRPVMLNLLYGGETIGSFMAHYTPGAVSFDEPGKITAAIPTLTQPDKIRSVLGQPMPANAGQLCTAKRTENCGLLTPEVAAVIFDEQALNAELFINKDYLSIVENNRERFLPLPQSGGSSVHAFSGAVSGTDADKPNFTLANNTTFSVGEAMLNTDTSVSDNGLRFDTATAGVERNGWQAMGGLFRSRPLKLVSDRDILGVAYSSSTRTRLDNEKLRGNDIVLYLARRSFVSLYREGRLYSSRAYEAGNQQIDTSELPEGAYTVTIKIQEAGGATREERRFFAKTEELPPPDAPLYLVQAGMIRKPAEAGKTLPDITDKPIIRAGTIRRLSDTIGLTASLLGLEDRAMIESGPFIMLGSARLSASALTSTKSDYGVQASYFQALSDFGISADIRRFWAAPMPMPGFDEMAQSMTQASATISYAVTPEIVVGAKSNYTMRRDMPTQFSAGPYAQWNIWQRGESMLIADAAFSRTGRTNEGNAMLRFSHKFGDYGVSGALGQLMNPNGNSATGNARVWRETHQNDSERLLVGAGVSGDNRTRAVSADADWDNSFGNVRGGVQQSFGKAGDTFSYGGNFSFNAAQVADEFHIGGTQTSTSAVIVTVRGDAHVPMKVRVDGVERAEIAPGGTQALYLAPFHTYRIQLKPAAPGLVDYANEERRVTLYPGNVVRLDWDVNKFYVIVGKVTGLDGQPLQGAILEEGTAQVATDEEGRIQAELAAPKIMTFKLADDRKCRVTLPAARDLNGVIVYKQPLACKPVGDASRIAVR